MTDAVAVGMMNQGITPSIWTMVTWGLGTYLTGNLLWASVISLVLVGFGFPLVWGILSGSMPRSGGEYIYNSRIIHPIVAIAESFGNAFVMIFWVYILAPWVADPGLVIFAEYQNWTWLYDSATGAFFGGLSYDWGVFVVATITNIIAFFTVVFGMKFFARIQKVIMVLALGGAAVVTASIMITSKTAFAEKWDALATQYDSLKYSEVVPAVSAAIGEAVPTSSTFYGTLGVMVAGSWLFAYAYFCVFVAGEVKRPDKTLITRQLHRHPDPGAVHDLDGALDVPRDAVRLHLVDGVDRQQRRHRGLQPALPAQLHEPGLRGQLELVRRAGGERLVHPVLLLVRGAELPRLPAHHLRLGHGPHGSQVVHVDQPALGEPGQELHPVLRPLPGAPSRSTSSGSATTCRASR